MNRKKIMMLLSIAILSISGLWATVGFAAETFQIMTEDYPPYNYIENEKVTGISTEIVREMTQRVGHPDTIELLSWARGYNLIQKKDGYALYSIIRTEAREDLFKWVGPLVPFKWVFFAKKGSGHSLETLDDAKKINKIGTYKDDVCELFLKEQGFTNIDSVLDDKLNLKKLAGGRIDLWIVADELKGIYFAKQEGLDDVLETVLELKETPAYIAFSKNTPDSVIEKWQQALDDIKADGTYEKILARYQ